MSDSSQTTDLRARMERIAAKPAVRPVAAPLTRSRPVRADPRVSRPEPTQPRLRTLRAWGSWELIAVPRHRWRWFTAALTGRRPD